MCTNCDYFYSKRNSVNALIEYLFCLNSTECVKILQFQCKITLGVCKSCSSTQIMLEIALFSEKIYTAGTNLTRPPVVKVATNLNSPHSPVSSAFTVSFSSIASPTHPPWYLRSRFNLMDLSRTIGFCFNNMNLWFYLWLHWHLTNIWPEICFFFHWKSAIPTLGEDILCISGLL